MPGSYGTTLWTSLLTEHTEVARRRYELKPVGYVESQLVVPADAPRQGDPGPNGGSPMKRQSARLAEGDDRAPARTTLRAIGS